MTTKKISLPTNRRPTLPGEMLVEEFLKPMGVSQTAFAKHTGISYVRLNEIVNGRRTITPDTAMRFARALNVSADFWIGLQNDVALWDAMHSPAAKAIEKIKPLAECVVRLSRVEQHRHRHRLDDCRTRADMIALGK
jgi:addiction module HigA family antidote